MVVLLYSLNIRVILASLIEFYSIPFLSLLRRSLWRFIIRFFFFKDQQNSAKNLSSPGLFFVTRLIMLQSHCSLQICLCCLYRVDLILAGYKCLEIQPFLLNFQFIRIYIFLILPNDFLNSISIYHNVPFSSLILWICGLLFWLV